jgi:hypothetical protein
VGGLRELVALVANVISLIVNIILSRRALRVIRQYRRLIRAQFQAGLGAGRN